MIKAVIFDMGGVLVNLDTELCIANFKRLAGFDTINDYLDRYHQKGFISMLEEGTITPEEYCERCIRLSRPGTTPEIVKECFCSLLVSLNTPVVELVKELRGKYDLYILSNNNPITRAKFADMLAAEGIAENEAFKKGFYSYEMHLLKPGREIYDRTVNEIGVKPEEVLFIDDSITNVEGAEAAGIRTVWLKPGTDIREEVMKILENQ